MKKERMNIDEVNANNDNIYPYVDGMLKNRMIGIKMLNKLFNGNIEVDYSSTWKDKADNRNTPKEEPNKVDEPKQEPEQKEEPKEETNAEPEQKEEKSE